MKKLIELRAKLTQEHDALSAQLEQLRTDLASATRTEPFDDSAAVVAVARAKVSDSLNGTATAPALIAELHDQREAAMTAIAAEQAAREDSSKHERHLVADLGMIKAQIEQLDGDIAVGIKAAASDLAAKELKAYGTALAKMFEAFVSYSAAARIAGENKLPLIIDFAYPFPLGADIPEPVKRFFRREGYNIHGISTYTDAAVNERAVSIRSEILDGEK